MSIPQHLLRYVVQQESALYTPVDHSTWRFILKISRAFFKTHAHQKYLDGLELTGISPDTIPEISEMDQKLTRFGWRAVAVSGFIPPSVFMEFLSLGVLPIACDMRKREHLAYTPAPDIVHEAAGHAPIIADPDYADYLRSYGEISRKAIYSKSDIDVYLAIRDLSEIKEDPAATSAQIHAAQKRLDQALSEMTASSEATRLARMGWWTFEYGLIGDLKAPKIYGAGLLSSVSESFHCLGPNVKRVAFSTDCADTSYDITRPQPQLFVAPDFDTLKAGLESLADTMAFRLGGTQALEIGKTANALVTVELDSGIQATGVIDTYLSQNARVDFFRLSGPVQLAYQDQELPGHGIWLHAHGFSSPIGRVKTPQGLKKVQDLTDQEFKVGRLEFESGIVLEGLFIESLRREGRALIARFDACTITNDSELLYDPAWGRFDLACGAEVRSVFGGAADRRTYPDPLQGNVVRRQKSNLTLESRALNTLTYQVQSLRSLSHAPDVRERECRRLWKDLSESKDKIVQTDWLIRYELLEILTQNQIALDLIPIVRKEIENLTRNDPTLTELAKRGFECLSS